MLCAWARHFTLICLVHLSASGRYRSWEKYYNLSTDRAWPKQQKQQLTLDLSSVHQRQSIWLWIATLSQPFKSMEIQSTMYQILDTLVPLWHLAQVISKGESHLLGGAFWKLEQLWKSPHISITTKVKLFNTTCVTILLYGCESWVISQDMENKINAFATSCYRVMLNIKRIDHALNTTVYSMTNTVPLIHLVRHRQLKFLGHILRMSKEEPARRYALYIPTIGKRRPGRPRTSYLNYVQRLLGDNEGAMQEQQIAAFADDRSAWRNLVVACSAADGWWWWWW